MIRRLGLLLGAVALIASTLVLVLFKSDFAFERIVRSALPEGTSIQQINGDLSGPVRLTGLTYGTPSLSISSSEVAFDWDPWALFGGALEIHRLALGTVVVTTGDAGPAESDEFEPAAYALPIDIVIDQLIMDRLSLDDTPGLVENLEGSLGVVENRFQSALGLKLLDRDITIEGAADLDSNFDHQLTVECACDYPLGSIRVTAGGNQDRSVLVAGNPTYPEPIRLTVYQPLAALRWELESELAQPFSVDIPLSGNLKASGNLEALTADGTLVYDGGTMQITGESLRITDRGLQVGGLDLAFPDYGATVAVDGVVPTTAGQTFDLTGEWQFTQEPYGPLVGDLALTGPLTGYRGVVTAKNTYSDSSRLAFEGDLYQVAVSRWETRTEAGTLVMTGTAQWADQTSWNLKGTASAFDPGRWVEGWSGSLNAEINGRGTQEASAVTLVTSGTLRDRPIEGRVEFDAGDSVLEAQGTLRSGTSTVNFTLGAGQTLSGRLQLDGIDLAHWLAEANGQVSGELDLGGTLNAPQISGDLQVNALRSGAAGADGVRIQATPGSTGTRINLTADSLTWEGEDWGRAQLVVEGTRDSQQFQLKLQESPVNLTTSGTSQLSQNDDISVAIDSLALNSKAIGSWQLRDTLNFRKTGGQLTLAASCFEAARGSVCADSSWNLETKVGNARLEAGAVPLLLPIGEDGRLAATGRTASARLEFDNSGAREDELFASLTISPGAIRFDEDRSVDLKKLQLNARGNLDTLRIDADMMVDELSLVMLGTLSDPTEQGDLDLTLSGRVPELGVYANWVTELASLTGTASIDVRATGQMNQPQIEGKLSLTNLDAALADLGIRLTKGRLESRFSGQSSNIEASFDSGNGSLEATGTVAWSEGLTGQLNLRGQAFQAVRLPELDLTASPDLSMTIDRSLMSVKGSVRLDQARVAIGSLSTAVPLSSDVTVVDDPVEQQTERWPLEADIEIDLGDAVKLEGYGLDVTLGGKLRVREQPGKPETGTGRVDLAGTYTAFGQELEISSGRLLFAGDPLDDPTLDLRARRMIDEVEAGITVSGRARAPTIDIYSVPAMEESEALSYLVLGRPLNSTGDSDSDLLSTAALGLGVAGSNRILSKLAGGRGFASIGVANRQALGGATFSVARYLSPRLYLSYSIGLEKAIDLVELQYRLSRKWSLESEVGEETRAKLKYKIERGRSKAGRQ